MKTCILVLDDHIGLRDSLVSALCERNADFVFLQAADGNQARSVLKEHPECRVLLLDLKLGDEDGLAVLESLRKIRPQLKTLVYSMFNEPLRILQAIKSSVQGYITKTADIQHIENALMAVAQGNQSFCEEALGVLHSALPSSVEGNQKKRESTAAEKTALILFENYQQLTKKEQELFRLISQKHGTREIAAMLGKSVKTVENQRTSIYQKLDVHDRYEAVEAARILGIIL